MLAYVPSSTVWHTLETFYDAVPRSSARVEEHGSLVLFLVHQVAPGLLEVVARAGLEVLRAALLVLDPAELSAPDARAWALDDAPEEIGVVAQLAFSMPGTEPGPVGVAERDAALTGAGPTDSRHRHAVAVLPGQGVVSVGTAQRAGDVVEIAGVGTLPSARRKGLGAAVTVALAPRGPSVSASGHRGLANRLRGRLCDDGGDHRLAHITDAVVRRCPGFGADPGVGSDEPAAGVALEL